MTIEDRINEQVEALRDLCIEYIDSTNKANRARKKQSPNDSGQSPTAALSDVFASVVSTAAWKSPVSEDHHKYKPRPVVKNLS